MLEKLQIKNNTSPDEIPNILLKNCSATLHGPITKIFNLTFRLGELPSLWKLATVLPLFKKDNTSQVSNYRPISLTSPLSKLAEKIIHKQLLDHLISKNAIPQCQHGFLAKRSVVTNLLHTLEVVTSKLDKKGSQPCDIIYFDFRKAFDSISHAKLFEKLAIIETPPHILRWLHSFLSNRTIRVKSGGTLSPPKSINRGVPQGSVLGPLLFLFFISDLPNFCHTVDVILELFADDLKAMSDNPAALEASLVKLELWVLENELELEPTKCQFLHLQPKKNLKFIYFLNGVQIKDSNGPVRDLGVLIDPDISFKAHIHDNVKPLLWVLERVPQVQKLIKFESIQMEIFGKKSKQSLIFF